MFVSMVVHWARSLPFQNLLLAATQCLAARRSSLAANGSPMCCRGGRIGLAVGEMGAVGTIGLLAGRREFAEFFCHTELRQNPINSAFVDRSEMLPKHADLLGAFFTGVTYLHANDLRLDESPARGPQPLSETANGLATLSPIDITSAGSER